MNDLIVVEKIAEWQRLKALVLDSVSSPITKRVYNMALDEFMAWFRQEPRPGFTKATVSAWRVSLEARGLGSSSIIIRMSAIRKLAGEAADNGLLAPELAAGIARVKSVKSTGIRVGNWLSLRQAQSLLSAPDISTVKGLRDRAILAVLLGCGLLHRNAIGSVGRKEYPASIKVPRRFARFPTTLGIRETHSEDKSCRGYDSLPLQSHYCRGRVLLAGFWSPAFCHALSRLMQRTHHFEWSRTRLLQMAIALHPGAGTCSCGPDSAWFLATAFRVPQITKKGNSMKHGLLCFLVFTCGAGMAFGFGTTYVPVHGSDTPFCGINGSPCFSLLAAYTNTDTGGLIKIMDANAYAPGGIVINRAVTIDGSAMGVLENIFAPTAPVIQILANCTIRGLVIQVTSGDAIQIGASGLQVHLENVTIQGDAGTFTNGVHIISPNVDLTADHVTVNGAPPPPTQRFPAAISTSSVPLALDSR